MALKNVLLGQIRPVARYHENPPSILPGGLTDDEANLLTDPQEHYNVIMAYHLDGAGSTNYYSAGGKIIAERRTGYGSNNGLFWLTEDHLRSTSVTANSSGTKTAEVRYKPWGEDRYTSGTTLTTMKYTGQRQVVNYIECVGKM
jgi:hypothetical protein